jgi:hypothetical protein
MCLKKERLSWIFLWLVTWPAASACADTREYTAELLGRFRGLRFGLIFDVVGAHTEYHYLREAAPQGNWAVSAFKSDGSQRAWRLTEEDGTRVMLQSHNNREIFTHPMLVAGDPLWENYRVTVDFALALDKAQSGMSFDTGTTAATTSLASGVRGPSSKWFAMKQRSTSRMRWSWRRRHVPGHPESTSRPG